MLADAEFSPGETVIIHDKLRLGSAVARFGIISNDQPIVDSAYRTYYPVIINPLIVNRSTPDSTKIYIWSNDLKKKRKHSGCPTCKCKEDSPLELVKSEEYKEDEEESF